MSALLKPLYRIHAVPIKSVDRIFVLKSKKIIERVGANKNGYWKIINKA